MTRSDLLEMKDADLHAWCIEHGFHGCRAGWCASNRCIFCGEDVEAVLDEITKREENGNYPHTVESHHQTQQVCSLQG